MHCDSTDLFCFYADHLDEESYCSCRVRHQLDYKPPTRLSNVEGYVSALKETPMMVWNQCKLKRQLNQSVKEHDCTFPYWSFDKFNKLCEVVYGN